MIRKLKGNKLLMMQMNSSKSDKESFMNIHHEK